MEEEFNREKKSKIIKTFLLLFIFFDSLVLVFFITSSFYENKLNELEVELNRTDKVNRDLVTKIANLENSFARFSKEAENDNKKIAEDKYSFPNKNKVFAIRPANLYYQLNNTKNSVDVYLETNNGDYTSRIASDVAIDGPGGGMPEFLLTSNPEITVLKIDTGDAGFIYSGDYYIDFRADKDNPKVLKVENAFSNGYNAFSIKKDREEASLIEVMADNTCFDKSEKKCKKSGTAHIVDLTINGKRTNILKDKKTISCFDPDGLGGCYKEEMELEYLGISEDLRYVYFSFTGKSEKNLLWSDKYSFDTEKKVISIGDPYKLLEEIKE